MREEDCVVVQSEFQIACVYRIRHWQVGFPRKLRWGLAHRLLVEEELWEQHCGRKKMKLTGQKEKLRPNESLDKPRGELWS